MQSVSFISHIVDFEVCEYACRVAIYRLDYNIYAPCNFVLCLGASKFGASNSSEIRTALPYQIPNEDPKRPGNLRQTSEKRRTGIYETWVKFHPSVISRAPRISYLTYVTKIAIKCRHGKVLAVYLKRNRHLIWKISLTVFSAFYFNFKYFNISLTLFYK